MLFDDQYHSIEKTAEGLFREKGSRFIAYAIPVITETEVKEQLDILRKKYYDATHHCFAYVLGNEKSAWRVNDDGEPSGTAGRPIYGAIQSADLTNILIVVIRYYGGVKLGVPGLINAYRTAAKDAIAHAQIITNTVKEVYRIEYPYDLMNDIMKILKEEGPLIISSEFGMTCVIEFAIRRNNLRKLLGRFDRLNNLSINYLKTI
ncbi:MAG TPA: YigZ family protein [Bacteroidales bacterium]|nr:YigZ family protein [Bacteroidales bacterium]HPT01215.1 YigZ family protein [Bacteroidales bacterium]